MSQRLSGSKSLFEDSSRTMACSVRLCFQVRASSAFDHLAPFTGNGGLRFSLTQHDHVGMSSVQQSMGAKFIRSHVRPPQSWQGHTEVPFDQTWSRRCQCPSTRRPYLRLGSVIASPVQLQNMCQSSSFALYSTEQSPQSRRATFTVCYVDPIVCARWTRI